MTEPQLFRANTDPSTVSRRRVLQGMLAAGGAAAIGLPAFTDAAYGAGSDKIICTLMLGGGNDGLNTLIPLDDGRYRDLRKGLAIPRAGAHSVGEGLYLNPKLGRLKQRFDRGDVAIVRGVGEPGLDHSHFSCMAKWMSGKNTGLETTGWLGRYLDGAGLNTYGGISIGDHGVPLLLHRRNGDVIGLPTDPQLFGADLVADGGGDSANAAMYRSLQTLGNANLGRGPWVDALAESQGLAIAAAQRMEPTYRPDIPEPSTVAGKITRDMQLAARVINLGVGARVVHAGFGDFDTHDSQAGEHDELMDALDRAIEVFFASLAPSLRDRVVLMTFSEFGRRVETNNSGGVDHGAASCLFVVGSGVTGGLYGQQPPLGNLDDRGDLRVTTDYRSVYATILDDYLGADSQQILGGSFENLGFFRPAPPPTTYQCFGQDATIVGTHGNDTLIGTPGRDVIVGLGGDDIIRGRGGNDIICAGGGNDNVRGGPGYDRIFGHGGQDRINGDGQPDRIKGGKGWDKLTRRADDIFVRQ